MNQSKESTFSFPFDPKIAYFTMEIAISSDIPTYSGGLGILAGDTIRASADQKIPIIAVTLLSEKGYFVQEINAKGQQIEHPADFDPAAKLTKLNVESSFQMGDHKVYVQGWVKLVKGVSDFSVPVIFLDTNLEKNNEWDRELTSFLYGKDKRYRIAQEMVLGVGGISLLEKLGYLDKISKFHMNEGHASFLTLALQKHYKDIDKVQEKCVFTTHTPVQAGIDIFDSSMVSEFVGDLISDDISSEVINENKLNMTYLGFYFSKYINGVAKKHRKVSKKMFPGFTIDFITNGIHLPTWVSPSFARLFNQYISGWKKDHYSLRYAIQIPLDEIWSAHQKEKKKLFDFINQTMDFSLSHKRFTIGFARRQTAYKRPDLLFSDLDYLKEINKSFPLQVLYAGKAHPKDAEGKNFIKKIVEIGHELQGEIPVLFLENYSFDLAKKLVAGVDLWLNNPRKPLEASGTSGMKAAANGIPQLSVLDGWWVEGHLEHMTGWAIGSTAQKESSEDEEDLKDLYNKLNYVILPLFYDKKEDWLQVMRYCIALNASFFNTQRMLAQYVVNAYFL